MSPRLRIDIITLDPEHYGRSRYILRLLQRRWEEQGLAVRVVAGGEVAEDASVAILHTDITRVPDEILRGLHCYPRVINGRVTDISKRAFSDRLLGRDDDYAGPVIVKTDANCGGRVEYARAHPRKRRVFQTGRIQSPWRRVQVLNSSSYPVFESIRSVPPGVWANPHLVVEKFLAERHGDLYCLRSWVFLGDRETSNIKRSPNPIVKASNAVQREPLHEVPDDLRELRAQLGFDYGKFDYGLVDGKVVLYDVNRTPTAGRNTSPESARRTMDALSDGIHCFL